MSKSIRHDLLSGNYSSFYLYLCFLYLLKNMKWLSNFLLWLLWYGERAKEGKEWKLCWSKLGKWAFGQHLWVYHNWCQVLLSHLEKEERKLTVGCYLFSSAHVEASLRSMLPCFVTELVNGGVGVVFCVWIIVFLYILLPYRIQNHGCRNYTGDGVLSILFLPQ